MAQADAFRETLDCPVCLDLLKDPVTVPCGHSFCMRCLQQHNQTVSSCPQCEKTFTPWPELGKNTVLAALVEELKDSGLQDAPADHCYAGAEDVACDFCSSRKLKALKSCLVCLASFCHKHLQPHYDAAAFKRHKLVDPSHKLQENICSRHSEVMKLFCRTDQQCICSLCPVDEHKGHDTVSAASERDDRQKELEMSRQEVQQRIQDREKNVKGLLKEVSTINVFADKAVEHSEKIFTDLICVLEKRCRNATQQIRSQQEVEVSRVKELQEKLEHEIAELRRTDGELQQLSHTDDHTHFLRNYASRPQLSRSTFTSSPHVRPLNYFTHLTDAVSQTRDKLLDVLRDTWTNISQTSVDVFLPEPGTRAEHLQCSQQLTTNPNTTQKQMLDVLRDTWTNISQTSVDVLLPEPGIRAEHLQCSQQLTTNPNTSQKQMLDVLSDTWTDVSQVPVLEPRTRPELLQFSCQLTLDPNTVNKHLSLAEGNRKVTFTFQKQLYPRHSDRFTHWCQVLSSQSLTGHCYWEVELIGDVYVAVSYKTIRRGKWRKCLFGKNDQSWSLYCHSSGCTFWYNKVSTDISDDRPARVGVFLDHRAGVLSFYSVCGTTRLLHRVQTTFTQPLYAGIRLCFGSTAELMKLNE